MRHRTTLVAKVFLLLSPLFFDVMFASPNSVKTLHASFMYFPIDPRGTLIVFDARDTVVGGGGISAYAWNFGDNSSIEVVTDSIAMHQFPWNLVEPSYIVSVTLNVTDTTGVWSTATKAISIPTFPTKGRDIRVWTSKCTEAYVQVPGCPNVSLADAPCTFAFPGESVHLWALVTYNYWPVQSKEVLFNTRDPNGGLFSLLENTTDENGIAHVRLFLSENAPLGTYNVTGTVKIADVSVMNSTRFELRQGSLQPFFTYSSFPYPKRNKILFDASASKLSWNGTEYVSIVNYRWDFGDGNVTTTSDPTTEHEYIFARDHKDFNVSLKIADAEGCRNSTSQTIRVRAWTSFRVPQDYSTIQEAITNAVDGDIVYVGIGTYHENIVVNKTVLLVGEDPIATIIDGGGAGNVTTIRANDVVIKNFTITDSGSGASGVLVEHCNNARLQNNRIVNNECGVCLESSSSNKIYHNNFANNTRQICTHNSVSMWDDGYPSGGNYWSSYTGQDLFSGPCQNGTGSDGIGDAAYVIDGDNQDRYPLMKPYAGPHDIGITNVNAPKTVVGRGYNGDVSIKVINYGEETETFNVTMRANSTEIHRQTVTLTIRNSTTITFTWNTTAFAYGNYTISAAVDTVSGEVDTTDNSLGNGWVTIAMIGDLTGGTTNPWDFVPDGKVDGEDMMVVAYCFGSYPGHPRWKPNSDINNDKTIDGADMIIVTRHYGETNP
jgi:parallel beta-helix repeat protein